MRHSIVNQVIEPNQVRDDLMKLEQEIVSVMNQKGFEDIKSDDKISVKFGDLDYWHIELRRLISFFC